MKIIDDFLLLNPQVRANQVSLVDEKPFQKISGNEKIKHVIRYQQDNGIVRFLKFGNAEFVC